MLKFDVLHHSRCTLAALIACATLLPSSAASTSAASTSAASTSAASTSAASTSAASTSAANNSAANNSAANNSAASRSSAAAQAPTAAAPTSSAPQAPRGVPELSAAQREAALRFDPRQLPRGERGAWVDWGPSVPPPEEVRAAFALGARSYQDGDYPACLALMQDVLRRAPDQPGALYQAATAYFRLRRYGDCAVLAERFVEVAPKEVGATQVLGHAHYTLGDYPRALEHYQRVVTAAPSSVEAWRGLGLARLKLGDTPGALTALERALALRPEHADALVWRAQALVELERTSEALESALRGRDLAPFEPRTWFLLGSIFAALGREADADAARARFVELNRIDQQVRAQEALLLTDPRAFEPRVRLVRLHVAAGDRESVAENLARLQRLLPDNFDVGALALEAHSALGDHSAAEAVIAELEKRFADNELTWVSIESYWRARGDEDRARRAADRRKALRSGQR
jgi:tetratricopeptide (TPR) repeat protein